MWDETLIKIYFHTNEPWKVPEYCASIGGIYDIVVEDMDRQSWGIKGLIEMKNAVKRKFLQRCFISSYYQSSKRMSRGSTAVENTICVCVLP